jgi:hypothetical protein
MRPILSAPAAGARRAGVPWGRPWAREAMTVQLEALDHVGLVVSDMSRVEITTYEPAPA